MHQLIPGLSLHDAQVDPGARLSPAPFLLSPYMRSHWPVDMFCWLLTLFVLGGVSHALEANMRVVDFLDRLNTDESVAFFDSLNLDNPDNLFQLVLFLQSPETVISDVWHCVRFDEARATRLVNFFLDKAELHPIVLPFGLFACDEAIREALSPHLEKYRPGPLIFPKYCRRNGPFEREAQIVLMQKTPALHISNPDLWHSALPHSIVPGITALLRWGSHLHYENPLLAALSFRFDWLLQRVPADFADILSRIVDTMPPEQANLGPFLVKYEEIDDWVHAHRLIIAELVQLGRRCEWPSWMQALWEGKLLSCLLAHERTPLQTRELLLGNYFGRFPLHDVPIFILTIIKKWAFRGHMLIEQKAHTSPRMAACIKRNLLIFDWYFPRNRGLWGDLRKHIARWRNWLRHRHPVVRSFDKLAALSAANDGSLTVTQLVSWWTWSSLDPEPGTGWSPLIDPTALPPLRLSTNRRQGGGRASRPAITSFKQLLGLITYNIDNSLLAQDSGSLSLSATWRMACLVSHTVIANLLYRGKLGFAKLPWITLFYDLYEANMKNPWTGLVEETKMAIQLDPALQQAIVGYLVMFGVNRIHPKILFQAFPRNTMRAIHRSAQKGYAMREEDDPLCAHAREPTDDAGSSLVTPVPLAAPCNVKICISMLACLALLIILVLEPLLFWSGLLSRHPPL